MDTGVYQMTKADNAFISFAPYMQAGEPTIGRTRLPADHIAKQWWYGVRLDLIQLNWPEVTRSVVLIVAWYFGTRGSVTWKKRWGDWARQWQGELFRSEWDAIALPPQKEKKA